MGDDYVWDKTGQADADVLELERTLCTLRHGRPLGELPGRQPDLAPHKPAWARSMLLGAVLSSALTLLLIWLFLPLLEGSPASTASVATTSPDPIAAPPNLVAGPPPSPPPEDPAARAAEVERLTRALRATLAQLQAALAEIEAMRAGEERVAPPATSPKPLVKRRPEVPAASSDHAIDCILDPSTCGSPREREPDPEPAKAKAKAKASSKAKEKLPEKLTSTDIKESIEPVKARAKACGAEHGALPGEKVIVKLSIAGATGEVTSANATGKYKSTPLGKCVAAVLKEARFPRFSYESLGVQFPILM